MRARSALGWKRDCRRRLTIGAIAAALTMLTTADAGVPDSGRISFNIYRNDSLMGAHQLWFSRQDDLLIVDVQVIMKETFLWLTRYEYEQSHREIWRDGRLVALESETYDNQGREFAVSAQLKGNRLRVEGDGGHLTVPRDVIPDSFWNPETVRRTELLDVVRGTMKGITVTPRGTTTISARQQQIAAQRYDLSGGVEGSVWYDEAGNWVGAKFTIPQRGWIIDYVLQ